MNLGSSNCKCAFYAHQLLLNTKNVSDTTGSQAPSPFSKLRRPQWSWQSSAYPAPHSTPAAGTASSLRPYKPLMTPTTLPRLSAESRVERHPHAASHTPSTCAHVQILATKIRNFYNNSNSMFVSKNLMNTIHNPSDISSLTPPIPISNYYTPYPTS